MYFFHGFSAKNFSFLACRICFNKSFADSLLLSFSCLTRESILHSSVNFHSTADFSTDALYFFRFSFVLFSEASHSSRRENCFSISWTMRCWVGIVERGILKFSISMSLQLGYNVHFDFHHKYDKKSLLYAKK